jgi:hypothetical protein
VGFIFFPEIICQNSPRIYQTVDNLTYSQDITSEYNNTRCLKIREFQIQSVVGDHFSSPNMEIKKNRDSPHKDKLI